MRMGVCAALAVAFVGTVSTTAVVADEWDAKRFPYAREHHERCQVAGRRLHDLEVDLAAHEGRRHELKDEMERLAHELDHDCGHWRWR